MVASRETLQDLAAERQLQPATLERVIRLIDILDAFGADTLIGPRIALKGGTALNVFHSDLDRLSVDIDVNYVGAAEKELMDADRPGLEDRIERLMESKGYAARRVPSEHAGGKWIYRYASALGGAGTIEIDINYLFRGPLYGVDRMPSAPIRSYRATNVPVLDIHEIVAGKMVALVTRRAARFVRCASDHRHARSRLDEDQGGHVDDRCEREEFRLAHSFARGDRVRIRRHHRQANHVPA
jgi:hypothetical protein